MLAATARFADDAAAVEKTLRLIQGFSTAIIGLSISPKIAAPWIQARSQLALGRRYFRLLKWHSCWEVAYDALQRDERALPKLLSVGHWSFLGLYYFLEMPTITNAMGVTHYEWGPWLQGEADKCWFYAISFSILLSLHQLFALALSTKTTTEKSSTNAGSFSDSEKPKKSTKTSASGLAYGIIFTQLIIDCCDLTIPGASTGWIPVHPAAVGAAQFTSSALAGQQIWRRVQLGA